MYRKKEKNRGKEELCLQSNTCYIEYYMHDRCTYMYVHTYSCIHDFQYETNKINIHVQHMHTHVHTRTHSTCTLVLQYGMFSIECVFKVTDIMILHTHTHTHTQQQQQQQKQQQQQNTPAASSSYTYTTLFKLAS